MAIDVNSMMLKAALKFITPDQIREALKGITSKAIDSKKDYPLEKGEDLHAIILYENEGEGFASIIAIQDLDKMVISRFIETHKITDLAEIILNKI